MKSPRVLSVRQINGYIRNLLENDLILQSLWVQGEISNFKAHGAGHYYFTLKDEDAAVRCVMFRGSAELLPFLPENGMSVILYGTVSVYEKAGQYQLYVELMEPVGVGALQLAFEQRKAALAEEGLFDPDYKRELPSYPSCIAIITSPTGAALQDMRQIITRRNPSVRLVLAPALVQGEQAPASIISALRLVNAWGKADLILLGRGGGSLEDIWAFNDEGVVRAVFASEIPVVSAVGHETDVTLCDFVADLRAPTPSAAAELAVPEREAIFAFLEEAKERCRRQVWRQWEEAGQRLSAILEKPVMRRPAYGVQKDRERHAALLRRLSLAAKHPLQAYRMTLSAAEKRLQSVSPLRVLERGYALLFRSDGTALTTVHDIEAGERLTARLFDGELTVLVETAEEVAHGEKEAEL